MLASKYSLKGKDRFERVEKDGKITQSESFGLAVFDRKDDGPLNFGFIVSNKISPESTLRNRIKRGMKEAVRFEMGELRNGFDVVFLAKQKALRTSTDEIFREVRNSLKEAGLYKQD